MSKKSDTNIRNKFSSFFGGGQRSGSVSGARSPPEEFNLDTNTLNELGKGTLQNRLKLLKILVEKVEEKRLEKNGIKSLWVAIQDIAKEGPVDARHAVIGFLCALVSNHYDQLGSMRQTLFQYIKSCHPDDLEPCFNLLQALTNNGSNLHFIEEQIGSYLEELLPVMIARKKSVDLLKFLADMTKNNATYIDTQLLCAVFRECYYPNKTQPIEEIQECLNYIEVVVQYAIVPPSCIHCMMMYICSVRSVIPCDISPGVTHPASQSLKSLMKMLISIHSLEYTIIFTMCSFLEERPPKSFVPSADIQINTLHLLTTSLWNKSRASPKQHHCSAVLSSILKVIKSGHERLVVEVLESLKFYVKNHGEIMEHLSWDAMLTVIEDIVNQQSELKFQNKQVVVPLNSLLSEAERLYSNPDYIKCKDRFYDIIELCVDVRPIDSINNLMEKKVRLIVPGVLNWSDNLVQFMADFYYTTRPEWIRMNALEKCWDVVDQFYELYEDELLEKVVLKVLQLVHNDPNTAVRHRAVQFLVRLCYRCYSDKFYHIVNIILKVISVVVQQNEENESILICDELINLFLHKVSRTPSRHALFIFEGLIKLATGFYSPKFVPHFHSTGRIRFRILECLWRISMSSTGETIVYLPKEGSNKRTVSCPFIKISVADSCLRPQEVTPYKLELEIPTEATEDYGTVDLPYEHVDNLIYHCLNKEEDWSVLELTLLAIKKKLCNAQFHTRRNVDSLTEQLVELLSNSKRLEELKNTPKDFSASEVRMRIYPVIVRLIPYQARIYKTTRDADMCRRLLKALISGLKPKFGKICIEGLIVAAMEMPFLIKPRFLSNIIHEIAKMTVGRNLAIATLSFLSTVALTPSLYKDFTEEEYKMVISVILPYTDPVNFDVPVIHFAHVVVCNWYVRCHYKHRPAFKEYILGQLRSTVKSVDRKCRSNSTLTEQAKGCEKRKVSTESKDSKNLRPRSGDYGRLSGSNTPRSSFKRIPSTDSINKAPDAERINAHNQLIDVTEDLLERWMYSGRCNIIKKSPQLDLLFSNKKTKTWTVCNTLITISTALSCDRSSSSSCERCKMVQAITGEGSFNSSSDDSMELSFGTGLRIPIPGQQGPVATVDLNKIMTPKCSCWCKDFAHLEIRSPTSNSSVILRLQNKCHFVGLDAAAGGDSHVVTALFDDDLSQLLIKDVHSDYSPQQLEQLLSSNSSSGSFKHNLARRRRLSTPQADEMTPTSAIEVRQRSHSDLGVTEKSDPLKEPFVYNRNDTDSRNSSVEICERFADKDAARTLTQAGMDDAFYNTSIRKRSSVFQYAKNNKNDANGNSGSNTEENSSRESQSKNSSRSSSPHLSTRKDPTQDNNFSPMTSRSSSTQELTSRSSSLKDCSKFSVDNDQSHWDIDPAFIFRQLYPLISSSADKTPLSLQESEDVSRALRNLDLILVSNTHKIGLIYVGPSQTNEVSILRNTYGSVRYVEFVKTLGDIIWLGNCDQKTVYIGGLDTKGLDGDYTVSWRDKTSQVVFHVATLMPQHDTDPTSTNKKRHIGNNFVTIVYNDSGLPYQQGTIKGQCNICDIVIEPQPNNMNLVSFNSLKKTKLADLKPHAALLISDDPLGSVVRHMAVNANGLCQVMMGPGARNAYSCNWLERLKAINRITSRSTTPISSPTPARRDFQV